MNGGYKPPTSVHNHYKTDSKVSDYDWLSFFVSILHPWRTCLHLEGPPYSLRGVSRNDRKLPIN